MAIKLTHVREVYLVARLGFKEKTVMESEVTERQYCEQ